MGQAEITILKNQGLRTTQSRLLVLKALSSAKKPLSQKDLYTMIASSNDVINLVTIYRIIESFEKISIIHKHPSSGKYILCSLQEKKGHHIMLSCQNCGSVEECCDESLCRHEDRVAKKASFTPKKHLSEIIGICASCK